MMADARIMGQFTLPPVLRIVGWVAPTVMTITALALIASWLI